jgi:phosphonate transport system substrate-binding protein
MRLTRHTRCIGRDGVRRASIAMLAAALVVAVACGGDEADVPAAKTPLVLGLVPSLEADKLVTRLEPLGEYLEAELGVPVRTFVPQDYTGLIEAMGSGRADIAMLPPFAAMLAQRRYGIEPLLISVRDGESAYRAQWMTTDAAVCDTPPAPGPNGLLRCEGSLAKVEGRRVAFTSPTSTSGYLFPALQLIEIGIDPETGVKPVFVGGHDAAVIAVLNGDVDFGVAYDDARTYILDEYPEVGERVIPFAFSPWIPNDGVQVRADLEPERKAAIARALLALAASEAALPREERTLYRLYEIDGFEPYRPGLYEPVERAFQALRDKIDVDG